MWLRAGRCGCLVRGLLRAGSAVWSQVHSPVLGAGSLGVASPPLLTLMQSGRGVVSPSSAGLQESVGFHVPTAPHALPPWGWERPDSALLDAPPLCGSQSPLSPCPSACVPDGKFQMGSDVSWMGF